MGEHEGLPTIAVRIGTFNPYSNVKDLSKAGGLMITWLSQPDAIQLFEKCIDAPLSLKFAIVHGASRNTFNRVDIDSTRELLGYDPQDNFYETQEDFKAFNIANILVAYNIQ